MLMAVNCVLTLALAWQKPGEGVVSGLNKPNALWSEPIAV